MPDMAVIGGNGGFPQCRHEYRERRKCTFSPSAGAFACSRSTLLSQLRARFDYLPDLLDLLRLGSLLRSSM
jgi:hypothetical protein